MTMLCLGLSASAVDIVEGGSEVPTVTFGPYESEDEGVGDPEPEPVTLQYIFDEAGVLNTEDVERLEKLLKSVGEKHEISVAVAFLSDYSGHFQTFCADFYESHFGRETDGILLTVVFRDRDWDLNTSGICKSIWGEWELDEFEEDVVPYLTDGRYADAVEAYAEHVDRTIDDYNSLPLAKIVLISLVIGFVIALISVGAMKGKLKSVRAKNNANSYIKRDSLNITSSSEIFLYRNVVKTPKQTQGGSGGGGTTRHSSSGGSYGGRSGKF